MNACWCGTCYGCRMAHAAGEQCEVNPGPACELCSDTGDIRNRYGEFAGRCSCASVEEIELARSGADVPGLEPGETGRRIAAGVESCPARHLMGERHAR